MAKLKLHRQKRQIGEGRYGGSISGEGSNFDIRKSILYLRETVGI